VDVTGNITVKLCEVGSEFNIFCTLLTMAMAAILYLFNPTRGVLIKFKKKLPWKPRYQNNGVG
jgi:hypothetical protein